MSKILQLALCGIEETEDVSKIKTKVFLGGTCNESNWRDEIIKLLTVDYFNPVVDNWTSECKVEELKQREECDICLYVITPKMSGIYSIAEAIDDSNKRPEKTVIVVKQDDSGETFTESELASFVSFGKMIKENGSPFFIDLKSAADYINSKQSVSTESESEDLTGLTPEKTIEAPIAEEKTIKMTGPLSEVYTKALQLVYAKPEDKEGMMAIESQANDALGAIAVKKALTIKESQENPIDNEYVPLNNCYVYSAYAEDFNSDQAILATSIIGDNLITNPLDRNILVVEGGDVNKGSYNSLVQNANSPALNGSTVRTATESLCKSLGIELYYSFEAFVIAFQKK